MSSFAERFNAFLAVLLVILGFLVIPVVFESVFAVSPLLKKEEINLAIFSVILVVAGGLILRMKSRLQARTGLIIFGMMALIYIELAFRIAVALFMNPDSLRNMEITQLQTYDEYSAFRGHPFLGYTRRPSVNIDGTEEIPPIYYYNKYGFNGLEVGYNKPPNTVRIACLGGSTTARGYPEEMQKLLDSAYTEGRIEVLNFGISGWSSAHTMVNYLLNVVAFDPDYIVMHQGWNEEGVRNVPFENFRPDYSHVYSDYKEPVIWDRYLVRTCLIYRYIISKLDRTPPWAYLEKSTTLTERDRTAIDYSNEYELTPFKRNTKTIIEHAVGNGIDVILTTMPRSTDENSAHYFAYINIDQCNEVTRSLGSNSPNFVDLDKILSGKNELFIDLAHMTKEGQRLKAMEISKVIYIDLMFKVNLDKNGDEVIEIGVKGE